MRGKLPFADRGPVGVCLPGRKHVHFCYGDSEIELNDYGWYEKNSEKKTHPVGGKRATLGGYSTCMGTCGSGVRTGMTRTTIRCRPGATQSGLPWAPIA